MPKKKYRLFDWEKYPKRFREIAECDLRYTDCPDGAYTALMEENGFDIYDLATFADFENNQCYRDMEWELKTFGEPKEEDDDDDDFFDHDE